ncbi:MAG TPA: low-specificity L-threonine aldolase [Candidatus Binatia bacterium]|nr:low-specificity L-threonine aldolase [Candidatus Binatia bacterium]
MKPIDLRSDTVTRPTPAMREAMARAEVGDDVYGEDPEVNRLQAAAARRVGKDAALFVPSGTMANQIAIRVHTHHGDLVLASEGAHLVRYESGAAAGISGVQVKTVGAGGLFDADDVRNAITPPDHHNPPTSLVAVENTHNAAGGRIFPLAAIREIAAVARERGLRLHLDGARIFNAEVATGIPAREWAEPFDTVSFCFSKGLGAPVGSILCGDADTIDRAHRMRKMLGGGMRQAGILAAAASHALEHHVSRLREDHASARRLAAGLRALGAGIAGEPETNIVVFRVADAARWAAAARAVGVLVNAIAHDRVRAVTHQDVTADDVEEALARLRGLVT